MANEKSDETTIQDALREEREAFAQKSEAAIEAALAEKAVDKRAKSFAGSIATELLCGASGSDRRIALERRVNAAFFAALAAKHGIR